MHPEDMKPGQQFMHHDNDRILVYVGFDASERPSPYTFCVFIESLSPNTGMQLRTPMLRQEELSLLEYRGYASLSSYLFMKRYVKTRWSI